MKTIKEVSEEYGVSYGRIIYRIKKGIIPAKKEKRSDGSGENREKYFISDEFLEDMDKKEFRKLVGVEPDYKEDKYSVSGFALKYKIPRWFVYDLIERGDIPVEKKKNGRGKYQINKDFIDNHSEQEIKNIIDNSRKRKKSTNKDINKDNVFDLSDLSDYFSIDKNSLKDILKKVDNKYSIKKVDGEYYLSMKEVERMEKDNVIEEYKNKKDLLGDVYYIYKIFSENGKESLKMRLFPYTVADESSWRSVSNKLKIVKYLLDKYSNISEQILCDYNGVVDNNISKNNGRKNYWYFTILPDSNFEGKYLFTINATDGKGNYYQYIVSDVALSWMQGKENVIEKKVSDMEYTIEKFKEEHPELKDNIELLKNMIFND